MSIDDNRRPQDGANIAHDPAHAGAKPAELAPGGFAWGMFADNDPIATTIARDNARLNRLARRVQVIDAAGFAHPLLRRHQFDLVLANILARPLIDLAPVFAAHAGRGARIALAGVLVEQAGQVIAAYEAGFVMRVNAVLEGWALLAGERR